MRTIPLLAGVLVSSMLIAAMSAAVDAAPRKDRVRGNAHGLGTRSLGLPPITLFDLRVQAQSGAMGEKPKGHVFLEVSQKASADAEALPILDVHVRVSCLRVASDPFRPEDRLATVAGVITRSRTSGVVKGEGLLILVFDSDDPNGVQGIAYFLTPFPAECPHPLDVLPSVLGSSQFLALTDGDVRVEDAEP